MIDPELLLEHIPALADQPLTVEPLTGGLTNRNFKIEFAGQAFVVRVAGADTELLGIDRGREIACLRAAAAAGVGAEVVAWVPEHQVLVTRMLPGKVLSVEAIQPDVLQRIAQALRRCHAAPVGDDVGVFSVFDTVRAYLDLARAKQVSLPTSLQDALVRFERIEKELRTGEPLCLCHNDLLPANFIDDGTTIRLIDWEYAGRGDRFFDLGNLAVNLQLSGAQEDDFLRSYFGEVRVEHRRRLKQMRLASDLREASWGFLQAAISKLHSRAYYLEYGNKHLERFLNAADGA